ncbi:hypothetical protein DPX39_100011200 [Trypanosoma brucei equiperdum]|uniref:Uncharacterized protein n=1 Tax=Trypanosoma brucei equiperdum TaxID=630700 RepID=A0A3L6KYI4_9TRYP|nr:hypothetical protein DPX39_100011200 [Trypanosoma brucei equiperdum]
MEFPQVTCDDVNALVQMCSIPHETAITSLKQCSSSLFVLLYQRLFNCTIMGIESSPYTVEQKKWNVKCVLNELCAKCGMNVEGIDAEKIVQLNEEHISRLIALFLEIANRMSIHTGAGRGALPVGAGLTAPTPFPAAALRPKLAEVPRDPAEDGTWYPPAAATHVLPTHLMRPVHAAEGHMRAAVQAYLHHNESSYRGHHDSAQLGDAVDSPHEKHKDNHDSMRSGRKFYADVVEAEMSASDVVNSGDDDKATLLDEEDDGGSGGSFVNTEEKEIPTSQLVEVWSAQVIPPKRHIGMGDSPDLTELRGQLTAMDKCLRRGEQRRVRLRHQQRQQSAAQKQRGHMDPVSDGVSAQMWRDRRAIASAFLPHGLNVDTIKGNKFYEKQPRRMIDYERRNEKIEMLRSVRFIDELEREVGRKMVQQHRDTTMKLREEVKAALERDRQEVLERRRLIREEDQKYRNAYTAILTAASNDLRMTKVLMLERMQHLAQQHALSLRESRRMCQLLKRESKERVRHDLLRYASAVTEWQSHFVI